MYKGLAIFGAWVVMVLLLAAGSVLSDRSVAALGPQPTREQLIEAFQQRDTVMVAMMERIVALEKWKESKEGTK